MITALVTGGNRGIGYAVCEGLALEGIKVLLGARDAALGKEAAATLKAKGLDVEPVAIDVSNQESILEARASIEKSYGKPQILINNAAILQEGSLLEIDDEALVAGMNTNLLGPLRCMRAFVPGMVEMGYGRIVNVSSGWGSFHEGLQGPLLYSVTKAALNAVTVASARSLPLSVKVNAVCPGWVNTRMGGPHAPRSVAEGADTIIWLATLPDDGPSGKFFRDREEIAW